MKIVLLGSLYPPHTYGGAEKAIEMLAIALLRQGHSVVVISLYPGPDEKVEEQNGVRAYYLPIDNSYWPFGQTSKSNAISRLRWHLRERWNGKAAKRVARILDYESPDVVHTHNITGFSVAVWKEVKRRKVRLVHTMHDYYLLCPRTTMFRNCKSCETRCTSCRLLTSNRARASRLPDIAVSVSIFTLEMHKRNGYFSDVESHVIYNIQPAIPVQTSDARSRSDEQSLTFGFIGRVEEEKGIETLLAATQGLNQHAWRLKIAGKGIDEYVNELRRQYPDPRIEWLGFTSSVEFYSSVDVVVLPSLWNEPLPYVCVESLHLGRALIVAEVGGLPEIAGLAELVRLFPAGDVTQLTNIMNDALKNSDQWKLKEPPSEETLARFNEETIVKKYIDVYQSI